MAVIEEKPCQAEYWQGCCRLDTPKKEMMFHKRQKLVAKPARALILLNQCVLKAQNKPLAMQAFCDFSGAALCDMPSGRPALHKLKQILGKIILKIGR